MRNRAPLIARTGMRWRIDDARIEHVDSDARRIEPAGA